MSKKIIILVVLLIGLGFFIAQYSKPKVSVTENKTEKKLEKIKVQAGWLLNGEFANVCSAIVNGYYKEEGLDVELIPGGPSGASFILATNAIAQDNNLDIGIEGDLVPLLRGRSKTDDEKLKVKTFGAMWNQVPYGFIVRQDSGLNSLKDFAKKKPDGTKYKIGVTADAVIQDAIAKYAGVPVTDLDIKIVGFDAAPFLSGQVDALAAYWTSQAYEVEKAEIKYKFLGADEIPGFSQPSQVLLATENKLQEKKDSLVKWLRATNRGTIYVKNNPAAAAQQILDPRCGGPNFDPIQEEWLIKKTFPLLQADGNINRDQVGNFATAYYNLGQIPRIPETDELIDYSIINELNK